MKVMKTQVTTQGKTTRYDGLAAAMAAALREIRDGNYRAPIESGFEKDGYVMTGPNGRQAYIKKVWVDHKEPQ